MAAVHDLSSAAQRRPTPVGCTGTAPRPVITPPSAAAEQPRGPAAPRPREEWIKIPIPAIIDDATLEAVATTARDNSSYSPRRTEPDTFLLRRLLCCAHCQV